VILQGIEAGGHVRGTMPGLDLLEAVHAALPDGYPLLLAGGIAERGDVRRALEAGAVAAVAGTRFLASEESRAHARYKERLLEARETILTELFGMGWPAPHRVLPNAATERWLGEDVRGPASHRVLNRLSGLGSRHVPPAIQERLVRAQRPGSRLLTPVPPTRDGPESLVETGPLYAGETVARIHEIRPAGELVAALTP
jgi:NAD(P)H-dependent flavin oxidoreductase YrpB (nitropropane dioxygenase family)